MGFETFNYIEAVIKLLLDQIRKSEHSNVADHTIMLEILKDKNLREKWPGFVEKEIEHWERVKNEKLDEPNNH